MEQTFRCGHPKTPDNTRTNGGTSTACRTCRNSQAREAYAANQTAARAAVKERMRKHRGGLKGHRNSQKATCPDGHPYDDENTYLQGGNRQCKQCRRARANAWFHNRRANGGTHTEREWADLCEAMGGRCLRCNSDAPLTKDHVVPVSQGGTNDIGNLQPLCRPCNAAKKDKYIDYRPALASA